MISMSLLSSTYCYQAEENFSIFLKNEAFGEFYLYFYSLLLPVSGSGLCLCPHPSMALQHLFFYLWHHLLIVIEHLMTVL